MSHATRVGIVISCYHILFLLPSVVHAFPIMQNTNILQQRQPHTTTLAQKKSLHHQALSLSFKQDTNESTSFKGIIWDIDGTLADSWKLGYDATLVVLERHNIPHISEAEYHDHTKYATPERLARHAGLDASSDAEEFHTIGQQLGDEFDDFYVKLVDKQTAGFYAGMSDILKEIPPSIQLGALTNACVDYAHAVLHTNNCHHRFGSIRGADNVSKPKPHPDGLWEVCTDLSLKPHDCVYIGDSPSDAMAAKQAGMTAVGVLWGSHNEEKLRAAPFDEYCASVDDLKQVLL